jgi:hypothetical protein
LKQEKRKQINFQLQTDKQYFEGSQGPCLLQEGLVDAQASYCNAGRHATIMTKNERGSEVRDQRSFFKNDQQ